MTVRPSLMGTERKKYENGPEFGLPCHWRVTLIELGRRGSKSVFIN